VAGGTQSTDFPVTLDAVQTEAGGKSDMFITRLAPNGKSLIYSTYYGGSENEYSETHSLVVDHLGQAHIACATASNDINTTQGALKPTKTNANQFDALLVKLSLDGTEALACTYFGGTESDGPEGLDVDSLGYFYVGGGTSSTDFPTTPGAIQTQLNGGRDGFVIKVNPTFDSLAYSTYFGGSEDDAVRAFNVFTDGSIGMSGQIDSEDYPVTSDAFQPNHGSPNAYADSYFTLLSPEVTIVHVNSKLVQKPLILYPNPVKDFLYWEVSTPVKSIQLLNLYGQVFQTANPRQSSICLEGIPSGIYWVEVVFEDGEQKVQAIVVE
jgi:hypothetical protein